MWPGDRDPYRPKSYSGHRPPSQGPYQDPYDPPRQVLISYELPGYGYRPPGQQDLYVTRGRFKFSKYEIDELKKAFGIMCLIFALAISNWREYMWPEGGASSDPGKALLVLGIGVLAGAIGLLTGFIGHEIAHKWVAQHYRHWAEFRTNERGLMYGLILAAVFGFALVAPGAVMIRGPVSKREEGHISIAGPASNMMWAMMALPLYFLVLPWSDGTISSATNIVYQSVFFLLWVNIALGAFNLIPIRPLDGSKILSWSKIAYIGCICCIIFLIWLGWKVVPTL